MPSRGKLVGLVCVVGLVVATVAGCSGAGSEEGQPGTAAGAPVDAAVGAGTAGDPPRNPYLADSVAPIGHFDSAQTDSQSVAGPTGPTQELSPDQLTYRHLGPGHFGLAISPPYPDGRRVIWSNGGDRISKLDADTFEVLAELPLPGKALMTEAEADQEIAALDAASGQGLATEGVRLAAAHLAGLAGVYYLLDADNTLFVGGADSVIAYRDARPGDPASPITVAAEWPRPPEVGGAFVGANLTYDGRLVMVTNEGWVVVVERDLSSYVAAQLPGAEAAPAHNAAMAAAGKRSGVADWVRNSAAVDDEGGIYVPSYDRMHKVVWTGDRLSVDPADGAWSEPYLNSSGNGSGATPSLMGFGADDRFVVITDGETLMNVVLFWRDAVPEGWQQLPGAPSRRIAGQLPADMGDPNLKAIQTEQSVVVGGYGALVVNNEPATVPEGFPAAATRVLVGYAGADPAFTPKGVQKFEWDPTADELREAWVNRDVSSVNSVPMVSTGSGTVYTVGAREGRWTLEGIDWATGESRFDWVTGSNRYNSLFSGVMLDQDGRPIHTTAFGILRYDVDGSAAPPS